MEVREVFLDILASLTAIMSKYLLVHFNKYTRSSKFLFNEHVLIWKKERDFSFLGNFNDIIWSISKCLEFTAFSGSSCCFGEELLKCQIRGWF